MKSKIFILLLFVSFGANAQKPDSAFLNLFANLANKINPIVVHIYTDNVVNSNAYGMLPRELLEMFGFPLDYNKPHGIPNKRTIGTGFIINSSGLILTNEHVVSSTNNLKVQLTDKTEYTARVIGSDPRFDVALIKISPKKPLEYARLGNSDNVKVGQWVAAFGNPFGHSFSMSKGIISATHRNVNELGPLSYLQTDASINPGNSGGPLVNTDGLVIGVNTAIDRRAQGIGFAIPINEFKKIRGELEKYGKVIRGYIGVSLANITSQAKNVLKLPSYEGALVRGVDLEGPAYKSGIQPNDVIVKVDKTKITSPNDLVNKIKDTKIGTTVRVEVFREGGLRTIPVKVGSGEKVAVVNMPDTSGGTDNNSNDLEGMLGVRLSNYSKALAQKYSISSRYKSKGPIITEIIPGRIASSAGLEEGDMIVMLNNESVKNARDFYKNLKRGTYNSIRVVNKSSISQITFNL